MLPLLRYTVLRLALFVGTLWLLYFLGASMIVALFGAAVVSFLLSYLMLRGAREQLAEQIADQVERRRTRGAAAIDPDAAAEDAALDKAAEGAALDTAAEKQAAEKQAAGEQAAGEQPTVAGADGGSTADRTNGSDSGG